MTRSRINNFFAFVALTIVTGIFVPRAHAEEPIIYSRDILYIVPKAETKVAGSEEQEPAAKKPENKESEPQKEEKAKEDKAESKRLKKEVTVNIRPETFLKQPGVFNFQPFMDAGGLLIILPEPRREALQPNNIYAPVDVVFVASDGLITQIAPSITPSNLEESVDTDEDTVGLLFLKAGDSESKDIRPGDMIVHSLFKTKPTILKQ